MFSACYHFYNARRLAESGNSPFEFMAEIILNYSKILQFLFGDEHNEIREELRKCRYSNEKIERQFISIMKLRDQIDVGHISFSILKRKQLNTLYRFLEDGENEFRKLIIKLFEKVITNEYIIKPDPKLTLKGKKLKTINYLLSSFQKTSGNNS